MYSRLKEFGGRERRQQTEKREEKTRGHLKEKERKVRQRRSGTSIADAAAPNNEGRICSCLSATSEAVSTGANAFVVMGLGSWVLGLGFWFLAPGSWLLALGSWLLPLGSYLLSLGSWLLALGFPSWLLGLLLWLLGFLASWFLGFLASWLLGFLASWLLGFLATWLLGFLASSCSCLSIIFYFLGCRELGFTSCRTELAKGMRRRHHQIGTNARVSECFMPTQKTNLGCTRFRPSGRQPGYQTCDPC